jgi:hypothetical protein
MLIARMPRSLLLSYCVLGVFSLLYLGLVHLPSRVRGRSLSHFPKEFVIALLFAAASALPAWDEARRRAAGLPRHHPLLLLCPLFAILCWLNCVAIEDWEQSRQAGRLRWLSGAAIAAGCLILPDLANHPARWLASAAVLSASLFLLLDRSRLADGASHQIWLC